MARRCWLLLVVSALTLLAEKKPKPPEVEITEVTVRRSDGHVSVDGKVQNVSEKPLNGLVVIFHFASSTKQVITSQRLPVDLPTLAPQGEAEFHAQMVDPVRAVQATLSAQDGNERELRVAKPGPYTIE